MKRSFIGPMVAIIIGLSFIGAGCSDIDQSLQDARQTAHQQFDPSALLKKYEYFKDVAAQLDAKKANILSMQASVDETRKDYGNTPILQWPRDARMDYNQSKQELMDTKLSFNILAGEYNAQMAKFNYAFCNAGSMPQGMPATDSTGAPIIPLARSYAQYSVN